MEDKLSVKLINPAKVNGKREPAGKTVTVSSAIALQLAQSGAIAPVSDMDVAIADIALQNADFEESVAVKAKVIAESIVAEAVYTAVTEITARNEATIADIATIRKQLVAETERANLLQAERSDVEEGRNQAQGRAEKAEARVADLEARIAEIEKPNTTTNTSESAATDDGSAPQAGASSAPVTKKPAPKAKPKASAKS